MNSTQHEHNSTRMVSRALGPFFFLLASVAVVRASDMRAMVAEFGVTPLWPWTLGAFNLMLGLVIIALHQYWHTVAAVIVSVLGWLLTLRGFFVIAFPDTALSFVDNALGAATLTLSRTGFVVLALIGLYLTYVGWSPAVDRTAEQATS